DLYYGDGQGNFSKLAPGTNGMYLETKGTGANPLWSTVVPGAGTITTSMIASNAITPPKMGQAYAARVYSSANQSTANSTDTVLAFDSSTFDTNTFHSNSTNNSRMTIRLAGLYSIEAQVSFASNSTGVRYVVFAKNGTNNLAYIASPAVSGDRTTVHVYTLASLAVNDYIEVVANQSSGGALNVEGAASDAYYETHFQIVFLGT
ncbi:MAG: hypothetical protein ACREQ5_25040, partial [Candidatus Dormibacteria bacterium]